MDVPPQLPAVMGDADGAVTVFSSRYARNIVHAATVAMGGAEGLVLWAKKSNDNEAAFWTKIFPKTITKELVVDDKRSIDDVINELDGSPHMERSVPAEVALDAEFDEHYS